MAGRALAERAPAKINLTLRVLRRRVDGLHEIESLVAFADVGDTLTLTPARALSLVVRGPMAAQAGAVADNLVLRSAMALGDRVSGLRVGKFTLDKRLPVAAGLGGGSADAAAALRMLARSNRMAPDDPRLAAAAAAIGADVPTCLDPRPRIMRGIGEILSAPLSLPKLNAVLANPGVALATRDVFVTLKAMPALRSGATAPIAERGWERSAQAVIDELAHYSNDLEAPAIALIPAVAEVLTALRSMAGCRLARMTGSGATCFALFPSRAAARLAANALRTAHPTWWVRAVVLNG